MGRFSQHKLFLTRCVQAYEHLQPSTSIKFLVSAECVGLLGGGGAKHAHGRLYALRIQWRRARRALIRQTAECISVGLFEEKNMKTFAVLRAKVCLAVQLRGALAVVVCFEAAMKSYSHFAACFSLAPHLSMSAGFGGKTWGRVVVLLERPRSNVRARRPPQCLHLSALHVCMPWLVHMRVCVRVCVRVRVYCIFPCADF